MNNGDDDNTLPGGGPPVTRDVKLAASESDRAIERAVRRVVTERKGAVGGARRDVHVKHHGCVYGSFRVDEDLAKRDKRFVYGVFQPGKEYRVWVRFSSSSKKAQSDTIDDGRGVAIKLLGVAGPRILGDPKAQQSTQDFIMLNGPAFFARNAAEMAIVADLEARDEFPSNFFLTPTRLRGLAALLHMAQNQPESPLDLTYFSQTPYKLGAGGRMKYRLRPLRIVEPTRKSKGDNYLFEALKARLAPRPKDNGAPANGQDDDVVFRFEIQLAQDNGDFPLDDATVVWKEEDSAFVGVAELRIPLQEFDDVERMDFAERMSFNPWNGHADHEPLGDLNHARLFAYRASLEAREKLNAAKAPAYDEGEWNRLKQPSGNRWKPPLYPNVGWLQRPVQLLDALTPLFLRSGLELMSSRWGFIAAPILLALIVVYGTVYNKTAFCGPLMAGSDVLMPSERMIPRAIYSPRFHGTPFEKSLDVRLQDITWVFRYAPIGAEFSSGIPYWIYRALPRMFPKRFDGFPDWSSVGFHQLDDKEYYESYHGLPRGLVMSDTVIHIGGNAIGVRLKRVSLNCASCHRGEVIVDGQSTFKDGMPNGVFDAAKFKETVYDCFRDARFNAKDLADEIDRILAEEHDAHPQYDDDNSSTPSKLTAIERLIYAAIVKEAKDGAEKKSIEWMKTRPKNGPGRLDAFGALRFEFLDFPLGTGAEPLATVDLPSIWNQGGDWRPVHHYDGNTADPHARNLGAIVGVGGTSFSIHQREVVRIGRWIESELHAPDSPVHPAKKDVDDGAAIYKDKGCYKCHGNYENGSDDKYHFSRSGTQVGEPCEVQTDELRARLVDGEFVDQLNAFGMQAGLWQAGAFRQRGQYICPPLDGIWARAPYLHNGSVPTLWHLLAGTTEQEPRPTTFVRGNPEYDQALGGFEWREVKAPTWRNTFIFDTRLPGNSNKGHDKDGQVVSNETDRKKLIAFLLTL